MKYFVVSNGEAPLEICFRWDYASQCAKQLGADYIDAFDGAGKFLKAFKLVDNNWTDKF